MYAPHIPTYVIVTFITCLIIKYTIKALTGINITYFNPIKCKFGVIYKDIVHIEGIQIIPLQKKIIASGINILNVSALQKAPKKSTNVGSNNKDVKEDTKIIPPWINNYFGIISRLFDGFQIALNRIDVREFNVKILAIVFVLGLDNKLNQISSYLLLKKISWNDDILLSDSLLSTKANIAFDTAIPLYEISTDFKFGKVELPMETIYNIQRQSHKEIVKREGQIKLEDIEDCVKQIINFSRKASNILDHINELNVTMDKFLVKDFAITTHPKLREITQYLSYYISLSNFTFNATRFQNEMPGYKLIFEPDDKPFKFSTTLSRLNICLNIIRKDTKPTLVKFFEIPNISLFGESNLLSQKFVHNYGDTFENAVCNLKGHISSPTVDIDVLNLSFYKSFLNNIKVFTQTFSNEPIRFNCSDKADTPFHRAKHVLISYFKSFFPSINMKFILEDPKVVLMDSDNLIICKLSTLMLNYQSKRSIISSDEKKTEILYDTKTYLELLDLSLKHTVSHGDYSNTIFKVDSIALEHEATLSPNLFFSLHGDLDTLEIDFSELPTMVMLNKMMRKLDCQILTVEQYYFRPLYEKFASLINTCENQCSIISKSHENEPIEQISPSDFLFLPLPEVFDYVKFDFRNLKISLGARSVFMPPAVFSSTEAQSSHDLVDGKLRKFICKMDYLGVALFGNYTQWKNKISGSHASMVRSGHSATDYKSYTHETGGLDDISTSESTDVGYLWNFNLLINDITCCVIGETPSSKNELTSRTVTKFSVLSVRVFPEVESFSATDEQKKVIIQIDNKRIKSIFCLLNFFLVISGIHTIHQIFSDDLQEQRRESWAKKYLLAMAQSKRKSCNILWNQLKDLIEINFSSELFNQVMSLPNGLKIRLDSLTTFATIKNFNDITITGEYFRILLESPTKPCTWERMIVIKKFSVKANIKEVKELSNESTFETFQGLPPSIVLENESWHFSVPYKFEIHRLIDNFSTIIKSMRQMLYSFKTSKNNLIIFPHEVKTATFPKIKLKSRRYMLSIADDPFEAKMNMIFQIGLQEQRSRLAKLNKFNDELSKKINGRASSATSISEILKERRMNPSKYDKLRGKKSRKGTSGVYQVPLFSNPFNNEQSINSELNDFLNEEHEREFDNLLANISTSWIRRVKDFKTKRHADFKKNFAYIWGNLDFSKLPPDANKNVKAFVEHPFLSNLIMENVDVEIAKPSCGAQGVPDFIHTVGKGVPKDTKYSIMIPMYIDAKFSEVRWHLRDYPLPFINVPPLSPSQSKERQALRVHGDLVICEDLVKSDHELRAVFVPLVPSIVLENTDRYYSLLVPRTVTSLKFYTDLKFDIFSKGITQINIGSSYQPAIQQVMQCLENISKPPLDPSKKTGFWDKARYLFHGRVNISWKSKARFEVALKGSKSPYKISGRHAGFIVGFGGTVNLNCNEDDKDPKKFLSCSADEMYFSIPNFLAKPLLVWSRPSEQSVFFANKNYTNLQEYASFYYLLNNEAAKNESREILKMSAAYIEKTGIKITGGMQFNLGIVFERLISGKNERTFDFRKHYDVRLTNPIYVKDKGSHDSYANFRSQFIHMSFTLLSKSDSAYNAMQLSPTSLGVFFDWWKTFSGNFPVRRGKLFDFRANAPKFGEHLYTISYHADVKPLFITHMVHNTDVDRFPRKNFSKFVEFTGVKGRAAHFILDLHQRKEVLTAYNKEMNVRKKVQKLKFLEGDVILHGIDIRVIRGELERLKYVEQKEDARYKIFDNDMAWLDLTDFKEAFFIDPELYLPNIEIKPFAYAPRFIYQKRASYGDKFQVNPNTYEPIKPFRNDISHACVLGQRVDIPSETLDNRISQLSEFRSTWETRLDEELMKPSNEQNKLKIKDYETLVHKAKVSLESVDLLLDDLSALCYERDVSTSAQRTYTMPTVQLLDRSSVTKKSFENRYFIINMLLKWNESVRDVIFRYMYLLTLSNEFASLASQKTLHVFEDMLQHKTSSEWKPGMQPAKEKPIEKKTFKNNFNDYPNKTPDIKTIFEMFENELLELPVTLDHIIHKNNFIQFIIPQIQLTTEDDPDSCVIVTAPNVISQMISFEPKLFENIYYQDRFMKRNGLIANNANAFIFNKQNFKNKYELFFDMSSYGQVKGAEWPPWLGVEIGFQPDQLESDMLIKDFSTMIKLQKISQFSSVYEIIKDTLHNETTGFLPRITLSVTSKEFAAVYKMITNLILFYKDTEKVELNHKIEKLSIGYDINNIPKLKRLMHDLCTNQYRLKLLENKYVFRRNLLDEVDTVDYINIYHERRNHLLRLYMLSKILESNSSAIMDTLYENEYYYNDSSERSKTTNFKISEIILHLMNDNDGAFDGTTKIPFLDIAIANLDFSKKELGDGFNSNRLLVQMMQVFNLEIPSAYHNLIGPYFGESKKRKMTTYDPSPLIDIKWELNNPVGGIRVIKFAESKLAGLSLHLEEEMYHKILKWLSMEELLKSDEQEKGEDDNVEETDENNSDTISNMIISEIDIVAKGSNPDFNEMIHRSTDYMIVEQMVINNFKLCISYKGKGKRRLVNVSDFVFTFPHLVFSNQTLRFKDILLTIRKVLIKVLLKHTGKFIGNKLKSSSSSSIRQENGVKGPALRQLAEYRTYTKVEDLL
ncbi:hypothetical protein KAFR_0A03130 [Kazachstania africana CBS 2517]|uniref:Uncharacterized protein n=1 Tax=Kazachstania africana (strain ATCC 22294 / BCRC 22015 / CBS 2517 / CECT 1963 / NBRC 1671 / NRRL Y-8276) TaxID=1071382 RepID=H2AMZ8_KAZAF|nr:hypothetical protein KAFR_0A03130 [Kazachstania africana CBS 2517]CCF55748.1 hypothetical protein KAFR_0A03130 [Kazachstania africana CBS 2517]